MDTIWHDVRYALRTLAKRPGFTVVTVLTLALGIGATTVIFGLVDGVLLESLPYEDPERLLAVYDHQPGYGNAPASYPEYLDWQENGEVFEQVAAYFPRRVNLSGDGEPARLDAVRVSANLLPTLGVHPLLGRGLTPDDEPVGAEPVVLISYAFSQSRFGGADPIGRVLRIDGESYTVAGVLPPEARYCLPLDQAGGPGRELWLPLRLDAEAFPRGMHFMSVLGRLAPGVTTEQAEREIEALSTHLQEEEASDHGIRLADLAREIVGDARPRLHALMGAVALVLLIGCANVANLLLARASARRQEIAVRLAVGASRGRLVRQLVTESLILASAGGVLGVLAAAGSLRWFAAARFGGLPRVAEVGIDLTVLGFAALVTLLTAALFGLAPALQSASANLTDAFRDAGRQGGAGQGAPRLRGLLVVAEVALSLVLLVGAGLLLRSFMSLTDVELGFQPDGLMTSGFLLPEAQYPDDAARVRFYDQALDRLRAIPGVEGAAL
ncbi:MAG: FtsX-like permease family protein, partial [bacterium]|nr:FtsX-like permease family protein [bacterium]